jgi:carboxyl-terminal processing protease
MSLWFDKNRKELFMYLRNKILCGLLVAVAFTAGATEKKQVNPPLNKTIKKVKADSPDAAYAKIVLMMKVMELLHERYVDQDKATYDKLLEGALKGMLHELDPYCSYESPKSAKQLHQRANGRFAGIGIIVLKEKRLIKIVGVIKNSPAEKAGLHPGDIILKVDGHKVDHTSLQQSISRIKGPPGTKVSLTIRRYKTGRTETLKIVRAIVYRNPVSCVKVLSGDIGYIKLDTFTIPAVKGIDRAISNLKKKRVKGLIIDLRSNPGGLLNVACKLVSRFIPEGKLIVSTNGRMKNINKEMKAVNSPKTLDLPIVILINGYSASASEIFSGSLKDHRRAVLVGAKTYGKGSIQRIMKLPNKGALKFTVGKYLTPSKCQIHGKGIEPDIKVEMPANLLMLFMRQLMRYPGEVRPKVRSAITDIQLQRAIDVLRGIILVREAKNND